MEKPIVKVLPNEPIDGTGRVRQHWFMIGSGPIKTNHQESGMQTTVVDGKIACMPDKPNIYGEMRGNRSVMLIYSDDPRAVTCPECKAVPEYQAIMNQLAAKEAAR